MGKWILSSNKYKRHKRLLFLNLLFLYAGVCVVAGPVNDSCSLATLIPVPNSGYGLGTFTSAQTDLTTATVQVGETFAPAIFVAGLDKKSVWYKFSISTIRAIRITLTQPGTTITAGDAGFAVYQTSKCLPTNADISSKLTPIVTFGNTYHPCVPSGEYLIQVTSNLKANGPVIVQVEISDQTGALYDHPNQAYAFGTVGYYAHKIDFNTECQSIEDSSEVCTAFTNATDYNKSAWLTFKTPSYFDYLVIQLSGTGSGYYFPSNNNLPIYRKFGYTLYKGNAVTTPIGSLATVDGCDSLASNGYYAGYKVYKCSDLDTGTTYSIQIFIKKDFGDDIRLGILVGGQSPTKAPKPILSAVPAPNAIGNLPSSPAGTLTTVNDVWGCNSRHNTSNCSPSLPDSGIVFNGNKFNLSSFFTFKLTSTSAIFFNANITQCGPQPLVRVFKQGLTNTCTGLDTANIIGTFNYSGTIDCLQPGDYTVQVSGQDPTDWYGRFNYSVPPYNTEQCLSNNLGTGFVLYMTAYSRKSGNQFSLNAAGKIDTINKVASVMQPLIPGINYSAVSDTMGCQNTLRPADTTCSPLNNKVIYREFKVADSGIVDFSSLIPTYTSWKYRLYSGDANALAIAQNVFAFPDKVTGMVPKSECFDGYTNCTNRTVCVIPGTYTFTTMGGDADIGRIDKPVFTFVRTRTKHNSPFTAQDLGSLWDTLGVNGGTIKSDVDDWSCTDNAVAINGTDPCIVGGKLATKAIYRQFYLNKPSLVKIDNPYYYYCYGRAYGTRALFYGKATNGPGGLSPVGGGWNCFTYSAGATVGCSLLPEGWYTVVSYNQGPSYDSTFRSLNLEGRYNSAVGYNDEFNITITPTCPGQKFNRPYKASVDASKQPHLIQWGNRASSTPAYPRTDTTFVLPKEFFNCSTDTPFLNHPVKPCEVTANRVVYYVFKTTQVSFLQINAGGYYAALYDKDVRVDSALFTTRTPIESCNKSAGYIQFCFFQPGTYTLVIFANDANICQSVAPAIYVDQIGYSRFDYAKNAYDFGTVPPDSTYHYGKVGDINPLNGSRKPSNDFFYCTTGAFVTDPTGGSCNTTVNPNVYNNGPNKPLYDSIFPPSNGITKRNLWYTFVVDQPGNVKVKVEAKTTGHDYQPKFAVYSSNVDGTLPFSTVVSSGQVDSTTSQGLGFVATNIIAYYPGYCFQTYNELSFYRDPCSSVTTRYYLLVENVNSDAYEGGGTLPNTQLEVSIQIDSITLVLPKHDHYSQAGDIGNVGVGVFQGDVDNYSCATKDATDPFYYYGNYPNCQKTLWYKFTPTVTGNVRYRMKVNGVVKYDYYNIQLFRQTIPGDSTAKGLQIQGYTGVWDNSTNNYWAECCVSPGTYYIMLTGCGQLNEYVFPEIQLIEAVGDFCSRAVPTVLNGPGAVTSTLLVNCHTIGADYGEFGPQLTCPQGANTIEYKSSWFRMDIGGTDTLDVTTYLVENTNAASSDIKYRLMTGNCGAMQEQSCVLDALTQNTYQCLVPGQSYFVQVFTPITKFNQAVTGTIDLKLSAIAHADTCAPLNNCLASANFTTVFDCNSDDSVKFVNFSTYGTSIVYKWSLGYNGQTSTAVSPSFFYPPLADDSTYTIKLVVENISCGKKDSVTKTVTVPGRPFINFGNDIDRCDGSPITLIASSHSGATYLWQNGSTADTLRVTATGNNDYRVKINYKGCSSTDTVKVLISPVAPRPLKNIILCTDSVSISAARGVGETFNWNTGATSSSIFVSKPGFYWVDIKYFSCTYRDSFNVNNVSTARPLGDDTTVCLSSNGFLLNAATGGAVSYTWQNGTTADSFKVTTSGLYSVHINFGSCTIKDTINVAAFPAPLIQHIDTAICFGQSLMLPWGNLINAGGIYMDTLRYGTGCDSLIRTTTVTVFSKPNIGKDTTVCLAKNPFLLSASDTGAIAYLWQDGTTTATYNVTAPGVYWVAVNFGNCSTVDSMIISAIAAPVTRITDTSICAGESLLLPWGRLVTLAGTYRDTIPSNNGCDSLIQIVNLLIRPKPTLGNDSAVSICSGNTFNLSMVYNTSGFSANWTIGGLQVINPLAVGMQGNYSLIALNTNGCSDTAILTLTYSPKPSIGNDTTVYICQGSSFNLSNVYNTTSLSGTWSLNNSIVNNPAVAAINGRYQLATSNAFGCADTTVVSLTVNERPSLGNDTTFTICRGNSVILTSIFNTTGLESSWTLNNVVVANPSLVSSGGTYQLIATNVSGCTDTTVVTINFTSPPLLGNDSLLSICQGNAINLSTVYNITNLSANWTLNNMPVLNPSVAGIAGTYRLIASNSFACADTAEVTISFNPKPVLGNDSAVSICQGNSFNLLTVYSTSNLSSSWTLNNSIVNNPAVVTTQGAYQILVSNSFGCKDTALVNLSLNTKPFIGNDTIVAVCQGNAINLREIYPTASNLSTNWTFNNAGVANPTASTDAGIYRIIATNISGCTDTALVTVTVSSKPNLGNDTTINICQGNSINLTSAYNTANVINYWTKGGIAVVNPGSVNLPGDYRLISTTIAGCSDTVVVSVIIVSNPVVVVNSPSPVCATQTTNLTNTAITTGSSTGLTYTYWTDAGAINSYNSPTVVATGVYYIKGTDANSCFDIKPVTVTNYPLPIVKAGNDTTICNQAFATLHASVGNNSIPVTYEWQPVNTGGIINPSNPVTIVRPGATQQYTVTVRDTYGCNYAVKDTVLVTMQPPVRAFAGNDTIAVKGLPHQLMATGGISYIWSPGSLLNNPYVANPLATLNRDSTLFVVEVRNITGCTGHDSVWVKTYNGITYFIPNAFSPNGDGKNDVFRPIGVGILSTEYFRIFNRYGEIVFETSQWNKGWDGSYKGKPLPIGNYVWMIKGKATDGKVIEMKGNVVLVK